MLPRVSVLFVTYNRAHTLVATYESFLAFTDYPRDRLELVLCDDGSDRWHRRIADSLDFDVRLADRKNRGLGANCNRGIDAAGGDFILQLQDDWLLIGPPDYLRNAVAALEAFDDVGLVAFRRRPALPVVETRALEGGPLRLVAPASDPDGRDFSVADGTYTDNPHLKRRGFHDLVGRYREDVPMHEMELAMCRAVARLHPRLKVAVLGDRDHFRHIGAAHSFNPSERRGRLIARWERFPPARLALRLARSARRAWRRRR